MRLDLFACANSDGKNSISKLTNSGQSRTASELLLAELFLLEASFLYYYQPLHRRRRRRRKEVIFDGGASLLSLPLILSVIRICDELGQSLPIWSFLVPIMRRVVVVQQMASTSIVSHRPSGHAFGVFYIVARSLALGTLVNQRWLTNVGHGLPTLVNQGW